LEEAAQFHGVNSWVMRAIIWHESRNKPHLVLRNTNGSYDIGLGGINTVHSRDLAPYMIDADALKDGCTNSYVTAWLLAKKVKKHGDGWEAIGAYHSETPDKKWAYVERIRSILIRWQIVY